MPIFEVQHPNGRTYEIDAPDQASALKAFGQVQTQPAGGPRFPGLPVDPDRERQLGVALQNADVAGDVDAARTLAGAIRDHRASQAAEAAPRFPGIPADDPAGASDPITLNIGGRRVKADRSFLSLSPEDQNRTVDEIAEQIGITPTADGHLSNLLPDGRAAVEAGRKRQRFPGEPVKDMGAGQSAILGAADGATFGFGDEAAAGLGYLLDKLPGERGRSYEEMLATTRGAQKQAQEEHPYVYGAGQIGGAVGTGGALARGGLSLGARAVQNGRGLGMTAIGSMADGVAAGAISGAGAGTTMDERFNGAQEGAFYGGALGLAAPLAVAGVSRAISPLRTDAARRAAGEYLQGEGVDLSAGQITGSKGLRYAESEIGGRAAENLAERQGEQFTAATLRRAGIDANRATPEVIDDAFQRIGGRFDDLASRNAIQPDRQMVSDLQGVVGDYNQLVPETARAPIVEGVARDIVEAARRGPIDGAAYQSLRSRLDRAARSSARDPELSSTLRGMKETLDDAMERSITARNPYDAGAWREVRNQYRNMIVIERAATGAGENAALGLISPSQLRNATVNGHGRRSYARGNGDFAELARSGEAIMKPMPQSGTAPRMAVRGVMNAPAAIGGILGGVHGGGDPMSTIVGLLAGAAVPRLAGGAMMSRPGQAYLTNQVADMSPHTRAIVNALFGVGGANLTGGAVSETAAKNRAIVDALSGSPARR